jgi:hypothetical protein
MTALLTAVPFRAAPTYCWTIICYRAAIDPQTVRVFAELAGPMKRGAGP